MDARRDEQPTAVAGESFGEAVGGASAHLHRTAFLLTGDSHRAERLLHSAVERGYRHWRWARPRRPAEVCVRRALVRLALDRRHTRPAGSPDGDGPADPRLPDVAIPPGTADLHGVLVRGLVGLPSRVRAVLVLRYWERLSEEQAARELGWSPHRVRSRSVDGLQHLHRLVLSQARQQAGPHPSQPTGGPAGTEVYP